MLAAAPSVADLSNLPGRCHELKGDRKGQFAIDLWGPFRLIFESSHASLPVREDGGLDTARITAIRIVEVRDYHGG
jgi:proteic killer suppression protein